MTDYQLGYRAYFDNRPFDESQPQGWQEGWEDAEDDDLDSCHIDETMQYGDEDD